MLEFESKRALAEACYGPVLAVLLLACVTYVVGTTGLAAQLVVALSAAGAAGITYQSSYKTAFKFQVIADVLLVKSLLRHRRIPVVEVTAINVPRAGRVGYVRTKTGRTRTVVYDDHARQTFHTFAKAVAALPQVSAEVTSPC